MILFFSNKYLDKWTNIIKILEDENGQRTDKKDN